MAVAEVATPGYLIWRLTMKWRAAVDRAVAPLGLRHAQYSVLASLLGMTGSGGRPSQRELADHTGIDVVYISKLISGLDHAGLVERTPHPADTRAVQLSLTPSGRAITERAVLVVRELQDQLLAPLGGTDGPRARSLVRDLLTLLDAELDERKTDL